MKTIPELEAEIFRLQEEMEPKILKVQEERKEGKGVSLIDVMRPYVELQHKIWLKIATMVEKEKDRR
jgi:hypothetical protein